MLWEELATASRFLLYVCTAICIGALFCSWLASRHRLSPALSRPLLALVYSLGALSVVSSYLLLVGSIAMAGVSGMFDWELLHFLLPDAAGKTMLIQLPAFVLLGLSLLLSSQSWLRWVLQLTAILLLLYGFTLSGHLLRFGLPGQLLLLLHLLCVGLWVGSLPALWQLCRQHSANQLYPLMQHFGRVMLVVLPALLLSGIGMLLFLFTDLAALWQSSYGRWLLGKLVLVSLLIALGALNKLKLVPALQQQKQTALKHAIALEMGFAVSILSITAILTHFIGWSS
ncbi:MAG: CopD family protein [Alkalimonas sp.]|nr:CopD family protein [Alkalimonas sp.]